MIRSERSSLEKIKWYLRNNSRGCLLTSALHTPHTQACSRTVILTDKLFKSLNQALLNIVLSFGYRRSIHLFVCVVCGFLKLQKMVYKNICMTSEGF